MNYDALFPGRSRLPMWAGFLIGLVGVSFVGLLAAVVVLLVDRPDAVAMAAATPVGARTADATPDAFPTSTSTVTSPPPAAAVAADPVRPGPAAATVKKAPAKRQRALKARSTSRSFATGPSKRKAGKGDVLDQLLGL